MTGEECGLLCEQNGEQKITKARKISKLNKMKGKQQQTQHGEEWMIIARERAGKWLLNTDIEEWEEYEEPAKHFWDEVTNVRSMCAQCLSVLA